MTTAVCHTEWAELSALHKQESLHGHVLDTEANAKQLVRFIRCFDDTCREISRALERNSPESFWRTKFRSLVMFQRALTRTPSTPSYRNKNTEAPVTSHTLGDVCCSFITE